MESTASSTARRTRSFGEGASGIDNRDSSDVPARNGVSITVRHRGDAMRNVDPECDEQPFVRLERKAERAADRIVQEFVERQCATTVHIVARLRGGAIQEDYGRDAARF